LSFHAGRKVKHTFVLKHKKVFGARNPLG